VVFKKKRSMGPQIQLSRTGGVNWEKKGTGPEDTGDYSKNQRISTKKKGCGRGERRGFREAEEEGKITKEQVGENMRRLIAGVLSG